MLETLRAERAALEQMAQEVRRTLDPDLPLHVKLWA